MPRPHSQVTRKSPRPSGNRSPRYRKRQGRHRTTCLKRRALIDQTFPEEGGYPDRGTPSPAPAGEKEGTSPVPDEPVTGSGSPAGSAWVISPPAPGQERPDATLRDEDLAKTDEKTGSGKSSRSAPSDELVPKVSGGVQKDTVPVHRTVSRAGARRRPKKKNRHPPGRKPVPENRPKR